MGDTSRGLLCLKAALMVQESDAWIKRQLCSGSRDEWVFRPQVERRCSSWCILDGFHPALTPSYPLKLDNPRSLRFVAWAARLPRWGIAHDLSQQAQLRKEQFCQAALRVSVADKHYWLSYRENRASVAWELASHVMLVILRWVPLHVAEELPRYEKTIASVVVLF